jgi:glycine/D-amino acid oxidase-like deaminating enzyme
MTKVRRNGGVSFWYADGPLPEREPPLSGGRTADVCIVGAGFTGLWAAYYLKRARPELEIVVLEREFAGFGASGRNGGWLSSQFAGPRERLAQTHGHDGVLALQRAMEATVDEVIAVCADEGIDADIVKSGVLHVARGPVQEERMLGYLAEERTWAATPGEPAELDAAELAQHVRIAGASAASWTPHAARVQPAKLVRGLADAVRRLGVQIYESTAVSQITPRAAISDRGTVRAEHVLCCVEGYRPSLRGERRTWLPLNSAMVATEPLSDAAWDAIGWEGAELIADAAHAYVYIQRTADGRIALGGRGVPYRFGSRTDRDGRTQQRTIDGLAKILHELFPPAASAALDHAWCGVLAVPRDWTPLVSHDRATGLGVAGGYVGNGVSTTNLAGRTLRDLVLGDETELTRLPWVGHAARRWEPEPLRWIGAHTVYGLLPAADRREAGGLKRTSRLAHVADLISGH